MEFALDQPKYGVRMKVGIFGVYIFPFSSNKREKPLEVKRLDLLQFLWKVYIKSK